MAFGDGHAASDAITQALARAGLDELPATDRELVAFVRAQLLAPLSEEIGPRLTLALIEDLVRQLGPDTVPPPRRAPPPSSVRPARPESSPRVRGTRLAVLLVDADRGVGRATLARALLRAESDVTWVDTVADLLLALEGDASVDAVLVDAAHPSAQAVLEQLARSRPDVAVVARSDDEKGTKALLERLALVRFDVRSRNASAEELIDALWALHA
jgi:hypothetical protein